MTAASEARRAVKRRRIKRLAVVDGVLLSAGLLAGVIALAVDNAPSVQADELPQPPKVTQPAPVAGPVQPIFDFADVQPWDPGKEPVAVVVSKATKIATSSRVPSRTPVARVPVTPPPRDDPLHDDGTFGDGCEQPGDPVRCRPVGLPPVEPEPEPQPGETPPAEPEPVPVVDEPPTEPVEEEPPVDEPVVIEPVTEVSP